MLTATPAAPYSFPHGRCPHWRLLAFQGLEPALHFPCRFVLNSVGGWAHVAWGLSQLHSFPTPCSSAYEPSHTPLPHNSCCLHGPSQFAQLPRQSPQSPEAQGQGLRLPPGELCLLSSIPDPGDRCQLPVGQGPRRTGLHDPEAAGGHTSEKEDTLGGRLKRTENAGFVPSLVPWGSKL